MKYPFTGNADLDHLPSSSAVAPREPRDGSPLGEDPARARPQGTPRKALRGRAVRSPDRPSRAEERRCRSEVSQAAPRSSLGDRPHRNRSLRWDSSEPQSPRSFESCNAPRRPSASRRFGSPGTAPPTRASDSSVGPAATAPSSAHESGLRRMRDRSSPLGKGSLSSGPGFTPSSRALADTHFPSRRRDERGDDAPCAGGTIQEPSLFLARRETSRRRSRPHGSRSAHGDFFALGGRGQCRLGGTGRRTADACEPHSGKPGVTRARLSRVFRDGRYPRPRESSRQDRKGSRLLSRAFARLCANGEDDLARPREAVLAQASPGDHKGVWPSTSNRHSWGAGFAAGGFPPPIIAPKSTVCVLYPAGTSNVSAEMACVLTLVTSVRVT